MTELRRIYRHIRRHRPLWPATKCYADAKIASALPSDSIYRILLLCYRPLD